MCSVGDVRGNILMVVIAGDFIGLPSSAPNRVEIHSYIVFSPATNQEFDLTPCTSIELGLHKRQQDAEEFLPLASINLIKAVYHKVD